MTKKWLKGSTLSTFQNLIVFIWLGVGTSTHELSIFKILAMATDQRQPSCLAWPSEQLFSVSGQEKPRTEPPTLPIMDNKLFFLSHSCPKADHWLNREIGSKVELAITLAVLHHPLLYIYVRIYTALKKLFAMYLMKQKWHKNNLWNKMGTVVLAQPAS